MACLILRFFITLPQNKLNFLYHTTGLFVLFFVFIFPLYIFLNFTLKSQLKDALQELRVWSCQLSAFGQSSSATCVQREKRRLDGITCLNKSLLLLSLSHTHTHAVCTSRYVWGGGESAREAGKQRRDGYSISCIIGVEVFVHCRCTRTGRAKWTSKHL